VTVGLAESVRFVQQMSRPVCIERLCGVLPQIQFRFVLLSQKPIVSQSPWFLVEFERHDSRESSRVGNPVSEHSGKLVNQLKTHAILVWSSVFDLLEASPDSELRVYGYQPSPAAV
jgi:hypothetical protein